MTLAHTDSQGDGGDLLDRLWLYTNYDCIAHLTSPMKITSSARSSVAVSRRKA
jgi:hypothetical protein